MNAAWKFIKMKWILFYFGCHSDGSLMPEWPEIDHHGGCQYNSKKLVLVFALETKEFYNFEINHIVLPFNGFYDVYSKSWLKYIIKRGASSRWSFRPNSAWGTIETTTIAKAHPTLSQRMSDSGLIILYGFGSIKSLFYKNLNIYLILNLFVQAVPNSDMVATFLLRIQKCFYKPNVHLWLRLWSSFSIRLI